MAKQTLEALLAWAHQERLYIEIYVDGSARIKKSSAIPQFWRSDTLEEALVLAQRKLGK